jgi:hypothetical protein
MAGHLPISDRFKRRAEAVALEMATWEDKPRLTEDDEIRIRESIFGFPHTNGVTGEPFRMAGVDGSGDYPSFSYADSFVYVATASGTVFRTDVLRGLVEEQVLVEPNLDVIWLPAGHEKAKEQWLKTFETLSGIPPRQVIEESDYRVLKRNASRGSDHVDVLMEGLVLPQASETTNCGIQLRTTAEWGTALRLIESYPPCRYVLMDTTMSLPFIKTKDNSLYYEHLKRLCCVRARERGIALFTISKSHGLPSIELLEGLACDRLGVDRKRTAEHWFLRLPIESVDDWDIKAIIEDRQIPPVGSIIYLFRLHRNTPVMRLDIDRAWWEERIQGNPDEEQKIFSELDYCGHDQRAYGYPFPIKACHDRTRLSNAERLVMKKQIIDAAVAQGMKRSLFRDVSMATGHS